MKKFKFVIILSFLSYQISAQEFTCPQPVGGKIQLKQFIEQELMYPENSLVAGTEGIVSICSKINQKGQVTSVNFRNRVSHDCDREALRIIRMLEWEAGTHRGIPIEDSCTIDIEFNIRKYNRLCKLRGYTSHLYPYEPMDTSGILYLYRNLETAPHPVFTSDKISLAGFIAANLVYPEAAIKQNLSGVVKIGFIVEPHGRISNPRILNSVGGGCNEEALRVVKLLKWMPGTVNRLAVRTRMSISINFNQEQGPDGNFNPIIKSSYGG